MTRTIPLDLRALHLRALALGRQTAVHASGDAEGLLWNAPRVQVLRRRWDVRGVLASELHALLDAHGRPLAWWQRSVAAAWLGKPVLPPAPHVALHEFRCASPALGTAGPDERERCMEAFLRALADVAGVAPEPFRHRRNVAVTPAHPHPAGA